MNYIHQIQIEKKCRKFDSYNRQKNEKYKNRSRILRALSPYVRSRITRCPRFGITQRGLARKSGAL